MIFLVAYNYGALALFGLSMLCLLFGVPIALLIKAGIEFPVFSLATELFGRESERIAGEGTFMFFLGSAIVSLIALFAAKETIAYLALLPVVFGDGLATIIGVHFGSHKIAGGKSIEGSLAFIFASSLALFLFIGNLLVSIAVSVLAALAELLPGDDNLIVPIFSALILYISI
jgi:dolichol kinase